MKKNQNIPTNIITGFLGVGKTTVIKQLLKNKPQSERWAVLVNEFGEVGIDGALMNSDGIAVKEVAGGCMCCAVGLPSRTALNRLIREQNPHRIIIEPTGLAHPRQVVDMFNTKEYHNVLDMRAVVCLVDPWSIMQQRFLQLPAFQDQITMSDVLVATKSDVSSSEQVKAFKEFSSQLEPQKQVNLIANGNLPPHYLDLAHSASQVEVGKNSPLSHDSQGHQLSRDATIEPNLHPDNDGIIRQENVTEFAHSCGWIFPKEKEFNFDKLYQCIQALNIPRVKGVFYTNRGCCSMNKTRDVISSESINKITDSRIEMINIEASDWEYVDQLLKACLK